MGREATLNLGILFDHELRAAADALRKAAEIAAGDSEEDKSKVWREAFRCAWAALYSIGPDVDAIVVMRVPERKQEEA